MPKSTNAKGKQEEKREEKEKPQAKTTLGKSPVKPLAKAKSESQEETTKVKASTSKKSTANADGFTYKSMKELDHEVDLLFIELAKHHGCNRDELKQKHPGRFAELTSMQIASKLIKASKLTSEQQSKAFTAFGESLRTCIYNTYGYTSPKNSRLYKCMPNFTGETTENQYTDNDKKIHFTYLSNILIPELYVSGVHTDRKTNVFSPLNPIKKEKVVKLFDPYEILAITNEHLATATTSLIKTDSKASQTSGWGSFWSSAPAPTAKASKKDKEEVLEEAESPDGP